MNPGQHYRRVAGEVVRIDANDGTVIRWSKDSDLHWRRVLKIRATGQTLVGVAKNYLFPMKEA